MATGSAIVELAMSRRGDRYVLGEPVPLANRNWRGPWDCAEFASWAAYHAYGITFAVRPPNILRGESYSGWWYDDALSLGAGVGIDRAIATPGAILVRRPGAFDIRIGHVAISRGNGTTIEAHSANVGVDVRGNVGGRQWSTGVLLPGVQYETGAGATHYAVPVGLLRLQEPYQRGDVVVEVQRALAAADVDPGDIDGIYGPIMHRAVAAYQGREGLLVDGVVGEETARSLGLSWPITP